MPDPRPGQNPLVQQVLDSATAYAKPVEHTRRSLGFGKKFEDSDRRLPPEKRLFDPGLPEDLSDQKALAPWVDQRYEHNQYMTVREKGLRARGAPHRAQYFANQRKVAPLNFMEDIMLRIYRGQEVIDAKRKRGEYPEWEGLNEEAYRRHMMEAIQGPAKQALYRAAVEDPFRPREDWSGEKVSPTSKDPRSGEYY